MKNDEQLIETVLGEISQVMHDVKPADLDAVISRITKDKRIFIHGAGRSGLQAKGFAMRLMHIGYTVYVLGETITPSLAAGDILVSVSGSGKTSGVVSTAEKAKKLGVEVIGVTSDATSPLAKEADDVLIVPGATKTGAGVHSIQLLSTLFDQTVHVTLDLVCLLLSERDHTDNSMALKEHTNLE
ncbi:6-phospho-3-hexuloisomerase [Levilactobacillus andaensis]|uniref:6-phospho-3-hexuloisomerase n=1 Tax=Levilactobacillus andaensis TaxID=2799570 RepID=UPI001945B4F3|nr:6-phospho-3-hexuloisomerase [Levilactobacillus andaensis]